MSNPHKYKVKVIWMGWKQHNQRVDWCNNQFGTGGAHDISMRWWGESTQFHFKHEQDAVLFALRWL